jgi:hypothetical protein
MLEVRVSASTDDAEQKPNGSVDLSSSDLELVVDGTSSQTVGMRFNTITIPQGAAIKNAYIQFTVDETGSPLTTALQIWAQAADNAPTFTAAANDLSSREKTAPLPILWSPPAWSTVGAAGTDQRTPDIKTLIQEIVDRPGWSRGNALVLLITGTDANKRVAEAYDGVPLAAPLLHVDY